MAVLCCVALPARALDPCLSQALTFDFEPLPLPLPEDALSEGDLEIRADSLETQPEDGGLLVVAEGDVRVRRGSLLLRAPRLEYDREARRARLLGGVVGSDGPMLISARTLEADFSSRTLSLVDGQALVKEGVDAGRLRDAVSSENPASASAMGRTTLTMRAEKLRRLEGSSFAADKIWLTTCACGDRCRPLLSISASHVEVEPGDVARLSWPWFWLFDTVPLPLPLPYVEFPLASRRSGVLFPQVTLFGPGGFGGELPLFLTLGESADLTLRPRYFFGPDFEQRAGTGFRGPGAGAEFRWRPAEGAAIDLRGDFIYDFGPPDSQPFANHPPDRPRGSLDLGVRAPLFGGRLVVDAHAVSDNRFLLDTAVLVEQASLPYLRSDAFYERNQGAFAFAFDSTLVQPLQLSSVFPQGAPEGPLAPWDAPGVLSPLVRLAAQQHGQFGPAFWNATVIASRDDVLPGLEIPVGRSRRSLAGLSLQQTVPLWTGRGGALAFEAGERVDAAVTDDRNDVREGVRAGGYAGLWAKGLLQRAFGPDWRHEIRPSLRLRVLGSFGSMPYLEQLLDRSFTRADAPQSELDQALPNAPRAQAIARIETSMVAPGWTPVRLWAESHVALARPDDAVEFDPGQLYVGAELSAQPVWPGARLTLEAGLDWRRGEPTLLGARLGAPLVTHPSLTAGLSVGGSYVNGNVNDLIGRGIDLLFTARPSDTQPAPGSNDPLLRRGTVNLDAGLDIRLFGQLQARASTTLTRSPGSDSEFVQQYVAGLTFDAAGCARFAVNAVWAPINGQLEAWPPQLAFTFELGDFQAAARAAAGAIGSPDGA